MPKSSMTNSPVNDMKKTSHTTPHATVTISNTILLITGIVLMLLLVGSGLLFWAMSNSKSTDAAGTIATPTPTTTPPTSVITTTQSTPSSSSSLDTDVNQLDSIFNTIDSNNTDVNNSVDPTTPNLN